MEKIKYSFIVPVYNVENYISDCLNSLLKQDYKNYEIIIIDDGSTDESAHIIKKHFQAYPMIKYIYQKNKGLGAARNTGIANSSGDYLFFVDSDDQLSETALSRISKILEQDHSDGIIFNMVYKFEDNTVRKRTPSITNHRVLSPLEALKEEFIGKQYKFHAPNKVFKRSIYLKNNIYFPEGRLYEDVATTYKLILNSKRISIIPDKLYYYLQKRPGSITANLSEKQFNDMLNSLNEIITNDQIRELNLTEELKALYVDNIIGLTNYIVDNSIDSNTGLRFYKLLMKDKNWNLMKMDSYNKNLSFVVQARQFLVYHNFNLYRIIMKVVKK